MLKKMVEKELVKINIENEARKKMGYWFHLANVWRVIDNVLVIISFFSSMFVVYIEATSGGSKVILVLLGSIVAATTTIMSFAIEPKNHMRNYRKAFYKIYAALVEYDATTNNNKKTNTLVDAIITGEYIINGSYELDSTLLKDETLSDMDEEDTKHKS